MKRKLSDFLAKEVLFEHLLAIYRDVFGSAGYDRGVMVAELVDYFQSPQGRERLAEGLDPEEIEVLYILRLVGGIAPRKWLERELDSRRNGTPEECRRILSRLRARHLVFQIGSDTAYLPEGFSELLAPTISGQPPRRANGVTPGPSALRQSAHGLVIALLNCMHQTPPRVMAEDERIWKRDLQDMADFFRSYLQEPGVTEEAATRLVRGRVSRLVELVRGMGFFEKRGKRLHVNLANWADWSSRSEVERSSLFLSFLMDHYEHIPVALEALVDWRDSSWIPLDRLTEAVRYRSVRSAFHVLRVRPQSDVSAEGPGRGWVLACVHLLADLGLVYLGTDGKGQPSARATEGGLEAWLQLHGHRNGARRRPRDRTEPRVFAQPNFELLVPEECSPVAHREIGEIARLKSLDRFWTYVLTPESVGRGVEEGLTAREILERLDRLAEGTCPANVRDAVHGWARTAWWASNHGGRAVLRAETEFFESILKLEGWESRFERQNGDLFPTVPRVDAARWLEERGIRVSPEERDFGLEPGPSAREEYARAVESWMRRSENGGNGHPHGSTWDDVIPVEPLSDSRRDLAIRHALRRGPANDRSHDSGRASEL